MREEFRELSQHYRKVFGEGARRQSRTLTEPLELTVEELQRSIMRLQARKGVPKTSFPQRSGRLALDPWLCRVAKFELETASTAGASRMG